MAQMKKPMTPAMKAKIKEMFPKVTKAEAAKQALTTKKPMPKVVGAKPSVKKPMPKTTTKAPAKTKMTPQDAAMKKILEKKYGKIYG